MNVKIQLLLVFVFNLNACSLNITPLSRGENIRAMAGQQGWQQHIVLGDIFDLVFYVPDEVHVSTSLVVYIEGDGLAWKSKTRPSADPTPLTPTALLLAQKHPGSNVAYLARPCQYVEGINRHHCNQAVWTGGRFSESVVNASNEAINYLKDRYQADSLTLIGYSGGGAVAALVAARRQDVIGLITVAGNLDHDSWTSHHKVTPLSDSLNPADFLSQLRVIPQVHFVGEKDQVVPAELTRGYVSKFDSSTSLALIKVNEVKDTDHHCCWVERWPNLYSLVQEVIPMR